MSKINTKKKFPKKLATPKKTKYEFDPHDLDFEKDMYVPRTGPKKPRTPYVMDADLKKWIKEMRAREKN